MRRLRVVIIGFGRLGRACAEAALQTTDLELVGVVVAPDAGAGKAPRRGCDYAERLRGAPVARPKIEARNPPR